MNTMTQAQPSDAIALVGQLTLAAATERFGEDNVAPMAAAVQSAVTAVQQVARGLEHARQGGQFTRAGLEAARSRLAAIHIAPITKALLHHATVDEAVIAHARQDARPVRREITPREELQHEQVRQRFRQLDVVERTAAVLMAAEHGGDGSDLLLDAVAGEMRFPGVSDYLVSVDTLAQAQQLRGERRAPMAFEAWRVGEFRALATQIEHEVAALAV